MRSWLGLLSLSLAACATSPDRTADPDADAAFQQGIDDLLGKADGAHAQLPDSLCHYLKPLTADPAFEHPYFFAGASLHAAAGVGVIGGVDAVYDLYDQQAAMFYYTGNTLETDITIGQTDAAGIAFGPKPNVLQAWSGEFDSIGVELNVPFVDWLGAGIAYFQSPDQSIRGANGTLTFSAGLALPITLAATVGQWRPFDTGTEQLAAKVFGVSLSDLQHGDVDGASYEYIQFHAPFGSSHKARAVSLGKGLFGKLGTTAITVSTAALALAIGVWEDTGKAIDEMCP